MIFFDKESGGGGGGGGGTESSWQIIQIRNKNWVGCGGRCVWSAGRVGGGGERSVK